MWSGLDHRIPPWYTVPRPQTNAHESRKEQREERGWVRKRREEETGEGREKEERGWGEEGEMSRERRGERRGGGGGEDRGWERRGREERRIEREEEEQEQECALARDRINLSRQEVSSEPPDSLLPFGIGGVGAMVCPTSRPPLT